MELKDFVKNVISDLTCAVEEVNQISRFETKLARGHENSSRTIEFDIAVTVENSKTSAEKVGIKVLSIFDGGLGESSMTKDSSVSRVKFGCYVSDETKDEATKRREEIKAFNRHR